MRWLLDTNAWIDYLKRPSSPIAKGLQSHSPSEIVVCSIVKAELFHGALKYGAAQRRLAIVQETLAPYASLPFDDDCAEHYARLRNALEVSGNVIGPHDLIIASICLNAGITLVTSNTREFSRVAGLKIEDWLSL